MVIFGKLLKNQKLENLMALAGCFEQILGHLSCKSLVSYFGNEIKELEEKEKGRNCEKN